MGEFLGAVLVGSRVSDTIRNKIVDIDNGYCFSWLFNLVNLSHINWYAMFYYPLHSWCRYWCSNCCQRWTKYSLGLEWCFTNYCFLVYRSSYCRLFRLHYFFDFQVWCFGSKEPKNFIKKCYDVGSMLGICCFRHLDYVDCLERFSQVGFIRFRNKNNLRCHFWDSRCCIRSIYVVCIPILQKKIGTRRLDIEMV